MNYGFRLYKLRVRRGLRGQTDQEMSELGLDGKTHASKHIVRLIEMLSEYGTLTTTPTIEPSGDDEDEPIKYYVTRDAVEGDPGISWLTVERKGKRRIDFEVYYGHVGRFGVLVGADKDDVENIGRKTAANIFRGTIFLPKVGTVGVLALETIGNAHPYQMIRAWLARASYVAKLEDKAIVEAKYAGTDEEEGDDIDRAESAWKPTLHPITDYNRLVELLTSSDAAEIQFIRNRRSKAGKYRKDPMRLTIWTAESAKRTDIAGVVKSTFASEGSADIPGAVLELQNKVVGQSVSGIEFDDVAIVAAGNGPKKTIRLSSLEKALTYNIPGQRRPGMAKWNKHVKKEINRLQTLDESELDLEL